MQFPGRAKVCVEPVLSKNSFKTFNGQLLQSEGEAIPTILLTMLKIIDYLISLRSDFKFQQCCCMVFLLYSKNETRNLIG